MKLIGATGVAVALLAALAACGSKSSPAAQGTPGATGTAATSSAAAKTPNNGCDLLTPAEVSTAAGHTFAQGSQATSSSVKPPVVAHFGCHYLDGKVAVGYDASTYDTSVSPATNFQAAMAAATSEGATQVSIGGNPGFQSVAGALQVVTFYKGQTMVQVTGNNLNTGAAAAFATLLAGKL